jgi:glycosyltransferase involved in cell wall biosynthesis
MSWLPGHNIDTINSSRRSIKNWDIIDSPEEFKNDIGFYLSLKRIQDSSQVSQHAISINRTAPPCAINQHSGICKVSCIMSTENNQAFIPFAISDFLNQDYPNKELVIVDNGTQSARMLIPHHPNIRYIRTTEKLNLGELRNFACATAQGSLILHWNDNDWHSANWISKRIRFHQASEADISGLDQLYLIDINDETIWNYRYPQHRHTRMAGGTLCYRKSLWEKRPFSPLHIGEDNDFIWRSPCVKLAIDSCKSDYIALIPHNNAERTHLFSKRYWRKDQTSAMTLMGDDSIRYRFIRAIQQSAEE